MVDIHVVCIHVFAMTEERFLRLRQPHYWSCAINMSEEGSRRPSGPPIAPVRALSRDDCSYTSTFKAGCCISHHWAYRVPCPQERDAHWGFPHSPKGTMSPCRASFPLNDSFIPARSYIRIMVLVLSLV